MTKVTTRPLQNTDLLFSLREGDLIELHGHYPRVESPQAVVLRGATKEDPRLVVLTLDDQKITLLGKADLDPEKHTVFHSISHTARLTELTLTFD